MDRTKTTPRWDKTQFRFCDLMSYIRGLTVYVLLEPWRAYMQKYPHILYLLVVICFGKYHEIEIFWEKGWIQQLYSQAGRCVSGPCFNIPDKTSYCKILQGLKAARFVFRIVRLHWNLTGSRAANVAVEFQSDVIIQLQKDVLSDIETGPL